jgi:hypothetical protein
MIVGQQDILSRHKYRLRHYAARVAVSYLRTKEKDNPGEK